LFKRARFAPTPSSGTWSPAADWDWSSKRSMKRTVTISQHWWDGFEVSP